MTRKLEPEEIFKVIRPLISDEHGLDNMKMPVMKKILPDKLDLQSIRPLGFQNLSLKKNNENVLCVMFNYDKRILRLWNEPFRYISLLSTVRAVLTPDYSAYPSMAYWEIAHNVFKNRFLGCLWQSYGIKSVPTITWALPDTYDVCFSGVERESVVAVSTVGCHKHQENFLAGYREMMRRISPSLVILYGEFIPGIYGNIFPVKFKDAFNDNEAISEQMALFPVPIISKIKEAI